jgi:predicted small metal-binding protein
VDLECECGYVVSADQIRELIEEARRHALTVHHIDLPDELILARLAEQQR